MTRSDSTRVARLALAVVSSALFIGEAAATSDFLFWCNRKVSSSRADDSCRGITLDTIGGIDGAANSYTYTNAGVMTYIEPGDNLYPSSIMADGANQVVFVGARVGADIAQAHVYRMNMDGTGSKEKFVDTAAWDVEQMDIDDGFLFMRGAVKNGITKKSVTAAADASKGTTVKAGTTMTAFCLDKANNKVFYADGGVLHAVNYDGTGDTQFSNTENKAVGSCAIDPATNKLHVFHLISSNQYREYTYDATDTSTTAAGTLVSLQLVYTPTQMTITPDGKYVTAPNLGSGNNYGIFGAPTAAGLDKANATQFYNTGANQAIRVWGLSILHRTCPADGSCAAGQYVGKCSALADGACMACTAPCAINQYASQACENKLDKNRVCAACSSACGSCTGSTNADCAITSGSLRNCSAMHYQDSGDSNKCKPWNQCTSTQYYASPAPTATTGPGTCANCDASCATCTAATASGCTDKPDGAGNTYPDCASGYYGDGAGVCKVWASACNATNQYQVQAPTQKLNRVCGACNAGCQTRSSNAAYNGCTGAGAGDCKPSGNAASKRVCALGYVNYQVSAGAPYQCVACKTSCPAHTYISRDCSADEGTGGAQAFCANCNSACASCASGSADTHCSAMTTGGVAHLNCSSGYYTDKASTSKCLAQTMSCAATQYMSVAPGIVTKGTCAACNSACQTCFGASTSQCSEVTASGGGTLFKNNAAGDNVPVRDCKDGYYTAKSGMCTACKTCTTYTKVCDGSDVDDVVVCDGDGAGSAGGSNNGGSNNGGSNNGGGSLGCAPDPDDENNDCTKVAIDVLLTFTALTKAEFEANKDSAIEAFAEALGIDKTLVTVESVTDGTETGTAGGSGSGSGTGAGTGLRRALQATELKVNFRVIWTGSSGAAERARDTALEKAKANSGNELTASFGTKFAAKSGLAASKATPSGAAATDSSDLVSAVMGMHSQLLLVWALTAVVAAALAL